MSHVMCHVGPSERPKGYEDRDWWNLPEAELMKRIVDGNQAFEDQYPCDGRCHDWLDELVAMACRYEDIAPGKAPWLEENRRPRA